MSDKRQTGRKYGETGFTLLEVMVAICILTVGLLAVASMQTSALHGSSFASRVTEGTMWGQDKMEQLMAISYHHDDLSTDGADNPHVETQAQKDAHPGFEITWNVSNLDANGDGSIDSKQISVTVTNLRRGFKQPIVLTCIRPQ